MRQFLIALLGLAIAFPATAQEWQVARESFTFVGTRLTIHVEAESPGTLRIIRGAPGSVRVASRTDRGFTAAGLAERNELTLVAAGPGPVDYMVSVPREVRVQVRLPGRGFAEGIGGYTRSRTFQWGAPASTAGYQEPRLYDDPRYDDLGYDDPRYDDPRYRDRRHDDLRLPPLRLPGTLYPTFVGTTAPTVITLPSLANVRSLSVQVEGDAFSVSTSRPLSVQPGSDRRMEIRPLAPPMDIVLTLPASTPHFRLEVGGATVLIIDGADLTALCSPVTRQWLSEGRRWVTFSPRDGVLQCTAPIAPRHEG